MKEESWSSSPIPDGHRHSHYIRPFTNFLRFIIEQVSSTWKLIQETTILMVRNPLISAHFSSSLIIAIYHYAITLLPKEFFPFHCVYALDTFTDRKSLSISTPLCYLGKFIQFAVAPQAPHSSGHSNNPSGYFFSPPVLCLGLTCCL